MNSDLETIKQDAKARLQQQMAVGLRIGLEALSIRLLMVLALVLNAASFGWCLFAPSWERLAAACVFAAFSYCVIHVKPKQGE